MDAKTRKQEEKRRKQEAQTRWLLWVFFPLVGISILSLPATLGIYAALLPGRGETIAILAAIGFALFSLFIAFLVMKGGLRPGLRNVLIMAFFLASLLNVLAAYTYRIPHSMNDFATLIATFNNLTFVLTLVEGVSLAGLIFAGVILMKFYHELNPSPFSMTIPEPIPALPLEPEEETQADASQDTSTKSTEEIEATSETEDASAESIWPEEDKPVRLSTDEAHHFAAIPASIAESIANAEAVAAAARNETSKQ